MKTKSIFANVGLIVAVSVFAVGASFVASYTSGHWHWFGRSGASATVGGLLLSLRPLVRMGLVEWVRHAQTMDGGSIVPTLKRSKLLVSQQSTAEPRGRVCC